MGGLGAVLSSAKIGTRSYRYYTAQVACSPLEYYLGIGDERGRWHGRGLGALGLEAGAEVREPQLEALFGRALHPQTGQRLGRAWRVDGVTGFDLTFSAPKSVSALWALGNPQIAGQVREAHRAAVAAALSYLDTHASWSRRGMDGTEQVATAGLAAALFEHRTSRCADPQLHTHALVINKVLCADGKWRTLDGTELFHHKKSAGTIYQAALRSELHASLGVVFEAPNAHGQAEIAGVPRELLTLWSKRTAQIEPEAAAKITELESTLGRSLTDGERAGVIKTAVLKTRPGKTGTPSPTTLHDGWAVEAKNAGHEPAAVLAAVRDAADRAPADQQLCPTIEPAGLATAAVDAAAGVRSTFSRAAVATQVAARLPVDARGAEAVLAAVEVITDHALGLEAAVPIGAQAHGVTPRASDARWAGAEVLAAEARILSLAGRGRAGGYGQARTAAALVAFTDAGLDADQSAAALGLCTSGDFLSVITAPAGAGKTTTLGAAARAWQESGYRVIGLAPSARAASELAAATGGPADTLAKWRIEHGRRGMLPPQRAARTVLDGRTVVILDEASMANTHDLDALITAAARNAAKVVLVGDPAQIGVINGPGGMLAALVHAGHGHELGTVHRFTQPWEAAASLQLRAGDPGALAAYRDQQRLHPCPDLDDAITALHAHWMRERGHAEPGQGPGQADGQPGGQAGGQADRQPGELPEPQVREVLMMARTRAEVDALNQLARATCLGTAEVHGPVVRIGDHDWQTGDVLRTRRNDRTLPVEGDGPRSGGGDGHVRNGDRWRVLAAAASGLHVEHLDRPGRDGHGARAFLPAPYVAAHADYGWATTITAAQGATVDVGLVLVRPGIDREHLYVALTRGREANHAYITPDPVTGAAEIDDHHGLPPLAATGAGRTSLEQRTHDVLADALARTGAQDAAHTVRDAARAGAVVHTRVAAEEAARKAAEPVIPAEHVARAELLTHRQRERAELVNTRDRHDQAAADARAELARTPGWRRGRCASLRQTIADHQAGFNACFSELAGLNGEIATLTRQVEADTRRRDDEDRRRALEARRPRTDRRAGYLAPAKSEQWRDAVAEVAGRETAAVLRRTRERLQANERTPRNRDHSRGLDPDRGRGRDDAPGIGW
jgi:conjugative relaxase-like TrwC/TraI family protein